MQQSTTSDLMASEMKDIYAGIQDFDAVVRVYWPIVYRFALASLREKDTAEVVAQECFLRAFRSRHSFRGDASVKTWVMQIAANLVRDHLRNRRIQFWWRAGSPVDARDLETCLVSTSASPEAEALYKEQVGLIWHATARLSQRQRAVFLLRFVEEMELAEIADVLGMKVGTVKAHLFRALNTVREQMRRQK
jgi:RNA polymerase sigma-70 factor (ECF subfamily)